MLKVSSELLDGTQDLRRKQRGDYALMLALFSLRKLSPPELRLIPQIES